MIELLVVAAGGGVGAAARFMVDGEIRARHSGGFPWGTFVVNVVGSFLIGVLATLTFALVERGAPEDVASVLLLALTVGLCGGFTTFSTATMESVRLAQSGRLRLALANSLGTLAVTVTAAGLGMAVGGLFG
ncbi:fluoride efflux transporter FluC [Promicromonospora iranensis]|uniref:Fluoride-specific ion channel FluC n=1 Tax=Promicromonospora iranensis TaxID=1105144 RepID=A0ABU2CP70_9MICO|nr:CrcB family protein [Promicromonospora iranensis]MDR7383136.1 CrcB protein [Promicromonospora iranensis]